MSIIKHGPLGALNIKEPGEGELETRTNPELNDLELFVRPADRPGEMAALDKDEARALRQALTEFIGETEGDSRIATLRAWWAEDKVYWQDSLSAKRLMDLVEHILATGIAPTRG